MGSLIDKRVLPPFQVERQRRADTIAKILILTFNDDEEKAIERPFHFPSEKNGVI